MQGELPSVRAARPELGEWVDRAIRGALNPKPSRRPESCLEFFKLLTARPHTLDEQPPTPTPESPPSGINRRGSVRHTLGVGTSAIVDTAVYGGGDQTDEEWPLVVRDVSKTGIGVVLARRFEPGTELIIELADEPSAVPSKFAIRVVRVKAEAGSQWLLGCEFRNPLVESELKALLAFA
jgi:hypothetical protein